MNARYPQVAHHMIVLANERSLKKQEAEAKLDQVIGDSHDVLTRARTVFPFRVFPDTLTVDRTKITITHRGFLNTAEVVTFRIEDILNITANVGPIFGSVKIATRFFEAGKSYSINYFWRADALRIKRIVQGYLIAKQQEVDCSVLTTQELAKKLDELGKVAPEEKV